MSEPNYDTYTTAEGMFQDIAFMGTRDDGYGEAMAGDPMSEGTRKALQVISNLHEEIFRRIEELEETRAALRRAHSKLSHMELSVLRGGEGAIRVFRERARQQVEEGYATSDDVRHWPGGELLYAAMAYLLVARPEINIAQEPVGPLDVWPFEKDYWNPSIEPIRNLEKAGALIAAEIDRLIRAQGEKTQPPPDRDRTIYDRPQA